MARNPPKRREIRRTTIVTSPATPAEGEQIVSTIERAPAARLNRLSVRKNTATFPAEGRMPTSQYTITPYKTAGMTRSSRPSRRAFEIK